MYEKKKHRIESNGLYTVLCEPMRTVTYEQLFIYRKNSRLSQLSKKYNANLTISMIQYKYLISTDAAR